MEKRKIKFVLVGGHLTPALAVIEEIKKREELEVIFIGRKHAVAGFSSVEEEVVREKEIPFFYLETGKIEHRLTWKILFSSLKILNGFFQAFRILRKENPQLIVSFGGYLSVPVIFAGWLLKIPSITHEQTPLMGLANRFNSFFVKKIAISWQKTKNLSFSKKAVYTGNPLREEFFHPQDKYFKLLKIDSRCPTIFVTGGNIGSQTINRLIASVLRKILVKYNVFHQCGHATGDYQKLVKLERNLPKLLASRYQVKKYLNTGEYVSVLKNSSLVICRAGGNTISELAYFGKPAILVPLPFSRGGEQFENASVLVKAGLAIIIEQKDLSSGKLILEIERVMASLDKFIFAGGETKKLVKGNSASKIVDLALDLVSS